MVHGQHEICEEERGSEKMSVEALKDVLGYHVGHSMTVYENPYFYTLTCLNCRVILLEKKKEPEKK